MQDGMLPGGERRGKALRTAWAELIERMRPTHLCTVTTRAELSTERLASLLRPWLRPIAQARREHVPIAWAIGPQERGAAHAHAALRFRDWIEPRDVENAWRRADRLCAIAECLPFDPSLPGALYMAAHPLLDVDLVCPRIGPCRRTRCQVPLTW